MQTHSKLPVSEAQKQFWLLDKDENAAAYSIISAFRMSGLKVNRFVQSIACVLASHPSLNVSFSFNNGRLWQTPHCNGSQVVRCDADTSEQALQLLTQHAQAPMEIDKGEIARLVLVEITGLQDVFVALIFHHIVLDLKAKMIIAREIEQLYAHDHIVADNSSGGESSYFEIIAKQEKWLLSESSAKAKAYWRKTLEGINRKISFPEKNGANTYFELPVFVNEKIVKKLAVYCRENSTDEFIVLLAAYHYLLSVFSGIEYFSLGVPLSNRRMEGAENVVGCFVNIIPLVVETHGVEKFSVLLRNTRRALLEAHRFQTLPLTEIIKIAAEFSDQRQLYNVGYTFEEQMQLNLAGVEVSSIHIARGAGQLDGFLRMWHENECLSGRLECSGRLWSPKMAQRFIESYLHFIEMLVSGHDELKDLDVICPNDRALLTRFNNTGASFDDIAEQGSTLVTLFEKQVARTPDAVAVIYGKQEWSYREFDGLANRFARLLVEMGVTPGSVLAVKMPRSADMLIVIYGILKAGAAYLPVDSDLPDERVALMLESAGASLCMVSEGDPFLLKKNSKVLMYCRQACDRFSSAPLQLPVSEHSPAYIIFTSGSTGVPKGVVNTHRGIVNRLLWMQTCFNLQPGERVLQKTPYSFDVSVWELFWPMQVGASLVIAPHNSHKDPYRIASLIGENDIAVLHFVPSMLSVFLNVKTCSTKKLRAVVCSGEELKPVVQERFFQKYPGVDLYNLYGPTEAAVDVSFWKCDTRPRNLVPIGMPVANTQLHVVNGFGQLLPVGVIGELWISGAQLAVGYVNNPKLTAERFVESEFGAGQVYKTGDFARWTDEGTLEYFGRKDFQIKINGVRIELGEIENTIAQYEGIESVLVVLRKSGTSEHLVAYLLETSGYAIDYQQLKYALSLQLPGYMVPSHFVRLSEFPISANGKIDRKQLPLPDIRPVEAKPGSDKVSATEKRLLSVWSDILGINVTDRGASFFDLGGNSLTLMSVYQALTPSYPQLSSVDMFKYTTIRDLAAFLDGEKKGDSSNVNERADNIRRALHAGGRRERKKMR